MEEAARVVEKARDELRPRDDERQRLDGIASAALEGVRRALGEADIKGDPRLGGSYAHGTWLAGQADIDVFILLEPGTDLEGVGLSVARRAAQLFNAGRIERRFAEHPYLSAEVDGVTVELVPCYRVGRGEWISAADRSPYHTEYLARRLNDELRDDIRVTKAFMRAQGVYGAEIKVRGFSGYLAEVLTLTYGSFLDLLRAATKWRRGEVVSPEPILVDVKALHKGAMIVVPDPVDQRRNLGVAVSAGSLGRFILSSEEFLRRPSETLLHSPVALGSSVEPEDVLDHVVAVVFERPEEPEDVLWGEVWKTARGLGDHLRRTGFGVIRFAVADDEENVCIAFLLDRSECCRLSVKRGPEVFMEDARRRFMETSSDAGPMWIDDDGRIYAVRVGGWLQAKDALQEAMRAPVEMAGAARGLEEKLKHGSRIFAGRGIADGGFTSLRSCIERLSGR